ncbi:facilitated trehalose transporter Tret1-like [Planococcus citri]|uniref:facilitated trehalose transporter Tret1-like n=1 Tax=Planococcus citri TaxID=170843 RepID=UPI0031F80101
MLSVVKENVKEMRTNAKDATTNVKYWHQTYGSVMASLTILMSSFWTIYISPVLLKFNNNEIDFNITVTEKTWIVSIMDFGNLLSPIVAGQVMDRYGRKRTLVFSALVYVACAVLVLFARSAAHLFAARLLAGISKGLAFTVTPIYVAEISSKNIRGKLSSYFYGFFCVGTVVATAIGPYVSFHTYNLISLTLPVFFLVMTIPLPESPYYYVMTNQQDKAKKALQWYRDISTKQKEFLTEMEFEEITETIASQSTVKGNYKELFANSVFRRALVIVSMIGLTQRFGGISYMLSYGAHDLPDSGARNWFAVKECFVVFSVVSILANIPPAIFVDRVGRKPILLWSAITTSVVLYVGVAYFVIFNASGRNIACGCGGVSRDDKYFWIPYGVVIFFSFSFTAGLGVLTATFQGEMFPSKIKRYASSTLIMLLSAASFLINLSHQTVTERFGVAGNYFVGATSCACFSVYAYFYVFETKGKTLKEIQDSLMGDVKTPTTTTTLESAPPPPSLAEEVKEQVPVAPASES